MRFNEKELKQIASKRASVQGTLQYMKPIGNDWSDWYQQSSYKDRVFKLVQNFLFYYRPTDLEEPLGVFILEQMEVAYEAGPTVFTFSLTSNDGKHIFACRCQEDLNKWVAALKVASYTYWKSQHEVLQCKLAKLNGTEWSSPFWQQYQQQTKQRSEFVQPLAEPRRKHQHSEQHMRSTFYNFEQNDNNVAVITEKISKSTFYSQSTTVTTSESTSRTKEFENHFMNIQPNQVQSNVPVDNLIDL